VLKMCDVVAEGYWRRRWFRGRGAGRGRGGGGGRPHAYVIMHETHVFIIPCSILTIVASGLEARSWVVLRPRFSRSFAAAHASQATGAGGCRAATDGGVSIVIRAPRAARSTQGGFVRSVGAGYDGDVVG
jgi:hypothetical protein